LAEAKVGGAQKLLPVTFLEIVATVVLYGLSAVPVSRILGLRETSEELRGEGELRDEPGAAPPVGDL
jgi:NhaP-type Na+/H+ or K+/H+ antiporter